MRSYVAIRMELDGEKYYMEQAEKHKNSGLYTIFLTLAKDERKHAQILEDRMKQLTPICQKPHRTMNIKISRCSIFKCHKGDLGQLDITIGHG